MTDNINSQMINDLKELMEDEFPVLLETFLGDADARLVSLNQALADGNAEQVRALAHAFKGSSANLGAPRLSEICFQLENLGRQAELGAAPEVLKMLTDEYNSVKAYFQSLL